LVDRDYPSSVHPNRDIPTRNALVRTGTGRALVGAPRPQPVHEIFLSETGGRLALRLKWALSTLIAGVVGLGIIGVVIFASTNVDDRGGGILPSFRHAVSNAMKPRGHGRMKVEMASAPSQKTDRIKISSKGMTTSQIIQDSVVQHRGAREFITVKPYIRIFATLGTGKPGNVENVPPFNPFELYASETPSAAGAKSGAAGAKTTEAQREGPVFNRRVEIRYSALLGGGLDEDGQALAAEDVERLVAETDAVYAETSMKSPTGPGGEGSEEGKAALAGKEAQSSPPQTTVIEKKVEEEEDDAEEEDTETRSVIARQGDTLLSLIKAEGAEEWQANAISEAMATPSGGGKLKPGQELRLTLALAAANPAQRDPIKVSLFTGTRHEATVTRSATGEYALGGSPVDLLGGRDKDKEKDEDQQQRTTLYNSIFQAAQAGKLQVSSVTKLLRVHIYDVDYKTKVQPGDNVEMFFDTKDDVGGENPGELLFTAMTVGGEAYRYYRFRTPDGIIDYYTEGGSSSKKFLMHMPVRAGRFTSGFGFRRHPLLGIHKMHTGVDWAAPVGTPILASGNGVIETAGREGGYGNYIRIKHGNGYKTAYGHLSRFASGISKGVKVRQGQMIGYVGSTGQSSGPHLHYEVLVNNRHVNPMGISVPRGRQLAGRQLADFRKERARIDTLMALTPVKTRMAAVNQ
jgi:murein DD-endopeptidase MepM/ murein hydrolase activator NlpD